MKLHTRKKWLSVLVALGWLLVCNVAVAETMFVVLHDVADSHSHSDAKHDHHTDRHAGHSVPHEHEGMPDHEPHGLSHSENMVLVSSPSVRPINVVFLTNFLQLFEVVDVSELGCSSRVSRFRDDPPPTIFDFTGSSPTRAPPFRL
jgi:hypothetical protein